MKNINLNAPLRSVAKHSVASVLASLLASLVITSNVFACATCACSLSSGGALGYSAYSGWAVSLDYSFIDQNQLRRGTNAISQSQVQTIPDQEVEDQTINRYSTLGISYSPDQAWNFKLLLPYIDRSHSTYGTTATLPLTPGQLSYATAAGLGDIKLISSYQGFLPGKNLGVQVGIKLPTGNYGGPSGDNPNNIIGQGTVGRNPVAFGPAGNSGSSYLDASVQVGTGSTDLIFGGYYFQPVSQNVDAFVNGQFQFAATHKLDQVDEDYRPGNQINASVGLRYVANPKVTPQLQINLTHKSADQGALADRQGTAGNITYVSPGVTVDAMDNMQIYAFVQLPAYSNLSGYQLFPHYTASIGAYYRF